MSEFKDERFAHIATDSRFRQMQRSQRKVKIDKRFKQMFTDKQFKLKYTIDKRGRPTDTSTNENLKKYYDISDSDSDDDDSDKSSEEDEIQKRLSSGSDENNEEEEVLKPKGKKLKAKQKGKAASKIFDLEPQPGTSNQKIQSKKKQLSDVDSSDSDSEEQDDGPDLARGVGNIESSSEEEEEDSGVEAEETGDGSPDHQWGELDKNVPVADELGKRLAICNLDWDRIKAVDVFVLLNSFVPSGGVLHSVKIYPSEYGIQRMEEEKIKGPQELVETPGITITTNDEDEDNMMEDREGSRYHREKLRQYQLNRLKYYYAVAECDSVQTASQIYEECDGTEYESSATKVDLRFIPDDMTFDHEPKSVCTEAPDKKSFKPSIFVSSAISQSKVNLTWDETDQDRIKLTMRNPYKKEEVNEDDFKAYLASSSDEEDPYGNIVAGDVDAEDASSDEEGQINKYKMLLQNIQEAEKKKEDRDVEMEVTWEPGLKETTEKILKKKEESKDLTPWEEYLQKKKEKKKKKREEKKKKTDKDDAAEDRGKKKKGEADEEEMSDQAFSDDEVGGVDMSDPFFAEELEDEEKTTVKKNKKKKKGKQKEVLTEEEVKEKKKREAELELLMEDDEEEGRKHFSLKKLVEENKSKKKKKKNKFKKKDEVKKEDDFKIDTSDKRFEAMFNSAVYNIDPTAPEYKKTKGMEALVEEKLKRRKSEAKESHKRKHEPEETVVKAKKHADVVKSTEESLASLVQSIKTKTSKFHSKTKK